VTGPGSSSGSARTWSLSWAQARLSVVTGIIRGQDRRTEAGGASVSNEQALSRPIGWWLKEADARLDAAFNSALKGKDMDRRGWQVLASLSQGPTRHAELVTALASFDSPAMVEEVIDHLMSRGWVEESADVLMLTPAGARQQEALAVVVDGVRQVVGAALSQDDYVLLVDLLARLVTGLTPRPEPSR